MKAASKYLLLILLCGVAFLRPVAQCPGRPEPGSIVQDPLNLSSQNGVLDVALLMQHSVDEQGYTHYCYNYKTSTGYVESPTLRVDPGDTMILDVRNNIQNDDSAGMEMPASPGFTCGDGGAMTISSTNVHFHGMNIPPKCHGDDVLNTLIQPGTPGFEYNFQIPTTERPGLYWYHPHVHGFTEFQVNGGAAGALIVNGMDKVRPEVKGLAERVFVIRQQYLVPWVPGPYQITLNYQVAQFGFPLPIIKMKPGEKQFWRIANATIQDFLPLQVLFNLKPQQLELIALDGYPLAQTRMVNQVLIPPAGRAEFIVTAPPTGVSAEFVTNNYSTGPTGNPDLAQTLANVELSTNGDEANSTQPAMVMPMAEEKESTQLTEPASVALNGNAKSSDAGDPTVTANRKLYFSEEFGGTNGPIQFYVTVQGQPEKVFEPNEKPVITTNVGAVEDWIVENRALETHAFHIHQIHFRVLEIDGQPVTNQDLRDTIEIPFWEGPGNPYHSVKLRMDFRDPTTAGTFVFHCHILLHEDLGMMHKIEVKPAGAN